MAVKGVTYQIKCRRCGHFGCQPVKNKVGAKKVRCPECKTQFVINATKPGRKKSILNLLVDPIAAWTNQDIL